MIPKLKPENIFSTSNNYYDGPPLPERYQDIILPNHWYIPDKGCRKKRRHKASHGVIASTDLSKQISTLWRDIDRDTKMFCSDLSDIVMQKYKKKKHDRKNQEMPERDSSRSKLISSFSTSISDSQNTFSFNGNNFQHFYNIAPHDHLLRPNEVAVDNQEISDRSIGNVDIDDDEIIDMYMSSQNIVAADHVRIC